MNWSHYSEVFMEPRLCLNLFYKTFNSLDKSKLKININKRKEDSDSEILHKQGKSELMSKFAVTHVY